jgi:hypothetical protein
MAEDAPAPATLGIGGGGAGGPRSSLTRLRHVISARDQLAIAAGVAQRREPAGPHAGPPQDSRLEFARPEPIYLHGGGFCPRRARAGSGSTGRPPPTTKSGTGSPESRWRCAGRARCSPAASSTNSFAAKRSSPCGPGAPPGERMHVRRQGVPRRCAAETLAGAFPAVDRRPSHAEPLPCRSGAPLHRAAMSSVWR